MCHANMRVERTSKKRSGALMADDEEAYMKLMADNEEAYMKLIDTTKDIHFTHPSLQTDSYLDSLAQAVVAQQNDVVHKDTHPKGTLRRVIQCEELVSDHDVLTALEHRVRRKPLQLHRWC
jgi:ATP-dependent helicase STH1/SNF2